MGVRQLGGRRHSGALYRNSTRLITGRAPRGPVKNTPEHTGLFLRAPTQCTVFDCPHQPRACRHVPFGARMAPVYAYVRPVSMQPCVEDGVATLAVCKPTIRRVARPGAIVAAYAYADPRAPRLKTTPSLVFAGRVAAVLPMSDYMGGSRRDSRIYLPSGARSGVETPYDAMHWTWNGLSPEQVIARDWAGRHVLVFDEFMHAERGGTIDSSNEPHWLCALRLHPPYHAGDRSRRGYRRGALAPDGRVQWASHAAGRRQAACAAAASRPTPAPSPTLTPSRDWTSSPPLAPTPGPSATPVPWQTDSA